MYYVLCSMNQVVIIAHLANLASSMRGWARGTISSRPFWDEGDFFDFFFFFSYAHLALLFLIHSDRIIT